MRTLGIASTRFTSCPPPARQQTWEIEQLVAAAKTFFDDVCLINPRQIRVRFSRGDQNAVVALDSIDLSGLAALIVRSTSGAPTASSLLARSLATNGCNVLDGPGRFEGFAPGKVFSSLDQFRRGVGSDSTLVFDPDAGFACVEDLQARGWRAVIMKPSGGSQGVGVVLAETAGEAREAIERWSTTRLASNDDALLIQPFMTFTNEWRVMVLDGQSLGAVLKLAQPGSVVANSAAGAIFQAVEVPEVELFVETHSTAKASLVGVDIAQTPEGNLHIIEENFSPQWEAFKRATRVRIAEHVVRFLAEGATN